MDAIDQLIEAVPPAAAPAAPQPLPIAAPPQPQTQQQQPDAIDALIEAVPPVSAEPYHPPYPDSAPPGIPKSNALHVANQMVGMAAHDLIDQYNPFGQTIYEKGTAPPPEPQRAPFFSREGIAQRGEAVTENIRGGFLKRAASAAQLANGVLHPMTPDPAVEAGASYLRDTGNAMQQAHPMTGGERLYTQATDAVAGIGAGVLSGGAAPVVFAAQGAVDQHVRALDALLPEVQKGYITAAEAHQTAAAEAAWGGFVGYVTGRIPDFGKIGAGAMESAFKTALAGGAQAVADDLVAKAGHGDPKPIAEILDDGVKAAAVAGAIHGVFHIFETAPGDAKAAALAAFPADIVNLAEQRWNLYQEGKLSREEALRAEGVPASDVRQILNFFRQQEGSQPQGWKPADPQQQVQPPTVKESLTPEQVASPPSPPENIGVHETQTPESGIIPAEAQPRPTSLTGMPPGPTAMQGFPGQTPVNPPSTITNPFAPASSAGEPASVTGFTTAKGSTYTVHEDGTTTRNKAARAEHPGEGGEQNRSDTTFYVTPDAGEALAEIQAQSGQSLGRRIDPVPGQPDTYGIRYTKGKDAGKFERRTVVQVSNTPAKGLLPVETWNDGSFHFGNEITDLHQGAPNGEQQLLQQPPEQQPAPAGVGPAVQQPQEQTLPAEGSAQPGGAGGLDRPQEVRQGEVPGPVEPGQLAQPPAAADYGTLDAPNREALGEHFARQLIGGKAYPTILHARQEASTLLGGPVRPGTPAAKHVDEAVEQGVTRAADHIVRQAAHPAEAFDKLLDLYNRQPSLNVRTSTSVAQQAYSTPAPLAYVASQLAGIGPGTTVYEPTAGNGMLLIGSDPHKVQANELNPERAAALKSQGFRTTTFDATAYKPAKRVDSVIMNPPFGAVQTEAGRSAWTIGGVKTNEVDQAITLNALQAMKDDGRAVMILGAKGMDATTDLEKRKAYLGKNIPFFKALYDNYNVVDHFTVNGDLYKKQGAGFPVDVIVVDGTGNSVRQYPWQQVPRTLNTWQEIGDVLHNQPARPERPQGLAVQRPETGGVVAGQPEPSGGGNPLAQGGPVADQGSVPAAPGRPAELAGGEGGRPGGGIQPADGGRPRPGRPVVPRPGLKPAAGDATGGEPAPAGPAPERVPPERPPVPGNDQLQPAGGGGDSEPRPDGLVQQPPAERKPNVADKPKPAGGDEETQHQVAYTPSSATKGVGTLVPRNMAQAVSDALDGVNERHGDIDTFVARELGIPRGKLGDYYSAEQVDALAMAFDNHKRGAGFVLGDQTGVGKGRVVAGIIQYARKQGLLPVFITEKPNLYADLIRDLIDTGQSTDAKPFEPLVTNKLGGDDKVPLPDGRILSSGSKHDAVVQEAVRSFLAGEGLKGLDRGKAKEFHALFSTYSQLQTVTPKGSEEPEQTWRNRLMTSIAPQAYFILDEAHNAGGSGEKSRGGKDEEAEAAGRAGFIREMIKNAPGVLYSSATYAKRPEVMTLYSRTDMAKAVEGDTAALPAAIKAGGVPLQQAVANMLAEAGQYVRRERTFKGVEMAPAVVDVGLHRADKIAEIFRAIRDFDINKQGAIEAIDDVVTAGAESIKADSSTGSAGVTSTNFSSIMWNLVDQMLLNLKVEEGAKAAIEAVRRGEQVVVALDNTMESLLDQHVASENLKAGDPISLDFRKALGRYLERSREIIISDGADSERHYLTDEELGPVGLKAYEDARELIENSGLDLPASPIDWLHMRLREAGLTTGEITGRQTRIEYGPGGKNPTFALRPSEESGIGGRVRSVKDFNAGRMQVLIINQAGSTGLSLHSHPKFENHARRHMIILQPAKNIDTFMQMLGRVHRTGQVVAPKYTLLMSNAPAETRPAAVLVKKLASLNASVTADRTGSVSFDVPDLINEVGDEVVAGYLDDNPEVASRLGDQKGPVIGVNTEGNHNAENAAAKVTGRVALLPVAEQQAFYDDVVQRYNDRIKELDALGDNPLVAHSVDLDAKTLSIMPLFDGEPGDPSPFAGPANLEHVDVKMQGKPMKPDEVEAALQETLGTKDTTSLMSAGQKWGNAKTETLRTETLAYATPLLEGIKDPEQRQKRENDLNRQFQKVSHMLRVLSPGTPVRITTGKGEELSGVVLDYEHKGKAKNPSAVGSWRVKVAVSDPIRTLTVSLSRIGDKEGHTRMEHRPNLSLKSALNEFEEAQTASREERYIATGNLLAAYAKVEDGRIVSFTDNQGRTRQGILLPKSFNPKEMLEKAPVPFDTAANAMRHINQGYPLATPDAGLKVYLVGGRHVLETAKSKAKGGRYFLNAKLAKAIAPVEFVSAGSKMRAVLSDDHAAKKAVNTIIDQWGLSAHEDKDEARNTLGLPSVASQIASRSRRTGFVDVTPVATALKAAGATFTHLSDSTNRLSGQMFPTITRASRPAGEAAARYVASRIYAAEAAPVITDHITGGDKSLDPLVGAVLTQDNLDSLRKQFEDSGDAAAAGAVHSLIGAANSPFATEAEYEKALDDPKVQAAIERYKAWFADEPEANYRVSQQIAPTEDLPTRGLRTEARINLKAITAENKGEAVRPISAARGNLTNPAKKRSPFARKATGAGDEYETSLGALVANTLGKGTEIANQHRLYKTLIARGLAVYGKPGLHPQIGDRPTVAVPVRTQTVILPGKARVPQNQMLYVRDDAYPELRQALNVDSPLYSSTIAKLANVANVAALASFSEAAYHIGNQLSALVRTPGTGVVIDKLIAKGIDVLKGDKETREQLVELAKIGALKEKGHGGSPFNVFRWAGKAIEFTDRVGRLVLDDAFTKLVEKGLAKNTETNRRNLVNSFGQYNKRAQHRLVALARDTGLGPFATAGTNFYFQGIKSATGAPGVEAAGPVAAARLRASVLGRYALALAAVALLNWLRTKHADGGKGVPLFALRLADGKDGKVRYIDVGDLIGIKRGLRSLGILGAVEESRKGATTKQAFDKGVGDALKAPLRPFEGPILRTGAVAISGHDTEGNMRAAKAGPDESQAANNLKAAAKQFNPLVDLATGGRNNQFGKFGVREGGDAGQTDATTLARRLAREQAGEHTMTSDEKAKYQERQDMIKRLRDDPEHMGETARAEVKAKRLTPAEAMQLTTRAKRGELIDHLETLTPANAMKVWDVANDAERQQLRPFLLRKIIGAKTLQPDDKKAMLQRVNGATTRAAA